MGCQTPAEVFARDGLRLNCEFTFPFRRNDDLICDCSDFLPFRLAPFHYPVYNSACYAG